MKAEPQQTVRGVARRLPIRWSAPRWRPRLVALGTGPTSVRLLARRAVRGAGAAGAGMQVRKSVRISFQPASMSAIDGTWGRLSHLPDSSNPQYRFLA